ncbi:ankyrin repeat protein [Ancylostoma duodenale]|uniref:Ankyrin repeat protein n=1 Tax=Ancylostoma duodenale TaxID=51022 RepID=A0A0C2C9I3_9BILA|nr:ankyrin repeat protein [Ancylostoma duodenale]
MFVSAWQEDDQGIREADLENPAERFLKEAENGNVDFLKTALEDDPSLLSVTDEDGYTALHRAAYNNHLDAVSFLLEQGANAEARTKQGWTPLHSAANWGNYEIIGRLITHGVDVNARSSGSVTVSGIDASVPSGSGDTPLELARRTSGAIYSLLVDHLNR